MAQQITDQQREAYYKQQEAAIGQQLFQAMVQTTKGRCFKACVTRPGPALSKDEQKCIINCVDRFFEARTVVVHSFSKVYETMQQQSGADDF